MRRALLTDGERAALRGDESVDAATRHTHRSNVKKKFENRLQEDVEILREHDPELFDLLQASVCDDSLEDRVTTLERELEGIKAQLEDDD